MEEQMMAAGMPPGFVFNPTDHEVFTSYLLPILRGAPALPDHFHEADVYAREPEDLAREFAPAPGDMWWFLSRGVHPRSSRLTRTTPRGHWHASHPREDVAYPSLGGAVATKQSFFFSRQPAVGGAEEKTDWFMEEYAFQALSGQPDNRESMVLCKISLLH